MARGRGLEGAEFVVVVVRHWSCEWTLGRRHSPYLFIEVDSWSSPFPSTLGRRHLSNSVVEVDAYSSLFLRFIVGVVNHDWTVVGRVEASTCFNPAQNHFYRLRSGTCSCNGHPQLSLPHRTELETCHKRVTSPIRSSLILVRILYNLLAVCGEIISTLPCCVS